MVLAVGTIAAAGAFYLRSHHHAGASVTPPLQAPGSLASRCLTPTVRATPVNPHQFGSPDAPKVGPIGFYPDVSVHYDAKTGKPFPSKVLIQPLRADGEVITLQGQECGYGAVLRFAYNGQVPSLASETTELRLDIADPNTGFAGYMLFTEPGDWDVDVFSGRRFIGNIVIGVGAG